MKFLIAGMGSVGRRLRTLAAPFGGIGPSSPLPKSAVRSHHRRPVSTVLSGPLKSTALRIIGPALLILGVTVVLSPNMTAPEPDRDSGVFLHIASEVLRGKVPYRDVWDHKGPMIYAVNAVALLLGEGSEMGIWLLEAAAITASACLLYRLMSSQSGGPAGTLSVAALLAGLVLTVYPGNFTEEFSLPFQLLAWLLVVRWESGRAGGGALFLSGLTMGVVFLFRPNNIGAHLAVVVFMWTFARTSKTMSRAIKHTGIILAGAAVTLVPVFFYFAANGALDDFVNAVWRYNLVYTGTGVRGRVDAILEGYQLLAPSGVALLGGASWLVALRRFLQRGVVRTPPATSLALLGLPIELLLVGAAGRSLNHYYVAWLPALSILLARLPEFLGRADSGKPSRDQEVGPGAWTWAAALAAVVVVLPLRYALPSFRQLLARGPRDTMSLSREVEPFLLPGEPLLMWGAESTYNFVSGHPPPTRFVYQYPLYSCGFATPEMIAGFLADLQRSPPLIVDSSSTNPSVPPISSERRESWRFAGEACALSESMLRVLAHIEQNYELAGLTPAHGWSVYRSRVGTSDGGNP